MQLRGLPERQAEAQVQNRHHRERSERFDGHEGAYCARPQGEGHVKLERSEKRDSTKKRKATRFFKPPAHCTLLAYCLPTPARGVNTDTSLARAPASRAVYQVVCYECLPVIGGVYAKSYDHTTLTTSRCVFWGCRRKKKDLVKIKNSCFVLPIRSVGQSETEGAEAALA